MAPDPAAPSALRVRPATAADLPCIARIYNEGIRSGRATFETRERSPGELSAWLERPQHPVLVAERGGNAGGWTVVGWIAAAPYRPRACYGGVAEFSVYVGAEARGRGVGSALMAAFVRACEDAGLWKLVARVFVDNAASRALLYRHGFREVGVYEKHAQLRGVWRDVVIVERLLGRNLS
ncbi:GCN5-related N-acetyltransferase [Truepera radiovictrix DSM 17093]|uniref:GCN5-related N-acetyltransferase n=1 Tax=Truepera radiovictrix (strain DSM 17093 / CIP 108686 / LMG 22925 / RQ-24) TaxID=649638 RepID=D7CQN1_TRURR|nr:GCN5-related N-acetyltransferase [Truepera radiovictrix DSM 17093]